MPVAPSLRHSRSFAQLVQVERDGNPLRRFAHASPFIGKLAALDAEALGAIAQATWGALPKLQGRTLLVGMTESSLLLSWFIARQAPTPVELRFTTRKQRHLVGDNLIWHTFEEPHSHGPRHFLALEADAHFDQIVIIEDELTTGATLRNLILPLRAVSTRFYVVTLNDMRAQELKSQLVCDLLEYGIQIQTFDLGQSKSSPRRLMAASPPPAMISALNPFQRPHQTWHTTQHSLDHWRQTFDFGAIYMLGECVDVPLGYWSHLPVAQRPPIQQITRSPWKVDGNAILTRADFPGDGTTSRYFLYNFAPLAARALIVSEKSNASVAAQAREFLESQGVAAQCVEVDGT